MIQSKLANALSHLQRSLNAPEVRDFQQLEQEFGELMGVARETVQETLKSQYWQIVEKLEAGEDLTDPERQALRLIVVGDADFYIQYENNYDDWVAELKRLAGELQKLQKGGVQDLGAIMQLRALVQDAVRVISDVTFYLSERERIRQFDANLKGELGTKERVFLAGIIRHKLLSEKY